MTDKEWNERIDALIEILEDMIEKTDKRLKEIEEARGKGEE